LPSIVVRVAWYSSTGCFYNVDVVAQFSRHSNLALFLFILFSSDFFPPQIGTSAPAPRNRASPSRLFTLNASLVETQRGAICYISFGGVLDIDTRTMKGDIVKFVMDCHDPELSQLVIPERGKISVDADSVERIWGLPRGRNKVAYEIDPDIVKFFNGMFNIPKGPAPTVTKWVEMIKEMGVAHDDTFLSARLVIVFSCFLAPTTSLKVSPRAYSAALNPCDIVNLDVCQFVFDQLRIAFMGFGDKKNTICCCLFHLRHQSSPQSSFFFGPSCKTKYATPKKCHLGGEKKNKKDL